MFNLATFLKILGVAQAATAEAGKVVQQWGSGDHIGAVQSAVQAAPAFVPPTSSAQTQSEATAAASVVASLVPVFFAFGNLFHPPAAAASGTAAK